MASPNTNLDGNLSPSKLAKARKLVIQYLSQFTNDNLSNEKIHSIGWFLYFINNLRLQMLPIHLETQSNSNLRVGSIFSMCPPFPSLPSSPNLSRNSLSFHKSHEHPLGCYILTWHVIYVRCQPSYLICFIGVIASSSLLS